MCSTPRRPPGQVPMVEPDIVLKGTHTLEQAVAINVKVQSAAHARDPAR